MTTAVKRSTVSPSGDLDGDLRWVGEGVEHRGALLGLGDQRFDLLPGGVGVDHERHLDVVEAVPDVAVDAAGMLGVDSDVRNGFLDIKVTFVIDADASREEIEALVSQSQKRSAVFDALANPTEVTVEVAWGATIERFTAVVIGAGHAGLAASHFLSERSLDHIVLERGEPANSWRHERWDSLRLLTPTGRAGYRGFATTAPTPTAT